MVKKQMKKWVDVQSDLCGDVDEEEEKNVNVKPSYIRARCTWVHVVWFKDGGYLGR